MLISQGSKLLVGLIDTLGGCTVQSLCTSQVVNDGVVVTSACSHTKHYQLFIN